MPKAPFYRDEARRCRALAIEAEDRVEAQRLHKMADEYALLAEEMDDLEAHRTSTLTTPQARQLFEETVRPKQRD